MHTEKQELFILQMNHPRNKMTKRNIFAVVKHPTHGHIIGGYLYRDFKEISKEEVVKILEHIHTSGLRDNGLTLWTESGNLFSVGKRLSEESTIHFIIEEK